jgi:hypothetical protein
MYQSEALWIRFTSSYPFAVKVGAGKVNAVTGETWSDGLHRDPQDYLVAPDQPWLDGFCVRTGVIRQFVAMRLGRGYSAEEQRTGSGEHGGIQLAVHPLKRSAYRGPPRMYDMVCCAEGDYQVVALDMGLAPGGEMTQEVYEDDYAFSDWDLRHRGRCFVHLANSLVWRAVTGDDPPTKPPTAAEYTRAGLPWFELYGVDLKALAGAPLLAGLESVAQMAARKGEEALPENASVDGANLVRLRTESAGDKVREGAF